LATNLVDFEALKFEALKKFTAAPGLRDSSYRLGELAPPERTKAIIAAVADVLFAPEHHQELQELLDALQRDEEQNKGGRPRALSAEQVCEMKARAIELWPSFKGRRGAQGRVAEAIRSEWARRGIVKGFSTIVRDVMKPLGF
jgi:hypothetical protein